MFFLFCFPNQGRRRVGLTSSPTLRPTFTSHPSYLILSPTLRPTFTSRPSYLILSPTLRLKRLRLACVFC